jgi:hypothetical protein
VEVEHHGDAEGGRELDASLAFVGGRVHRQAPRSRTVVATLRP